MSVHIRKDGAWIVRYREGGRERTRYFGKGVQNQVAAREFDRGLGHREWVRRGDSSLRFDGLCQLYIDASPGRIAARNLALTIGKLNSRILPEVGTEYADAITPGRLDKYVKDRLSGPYFRRPGGDPRYPKAVTVHRECSIIVAILRWGVRRGYLAIHPAAGWTKPKRDDAVIRPPSVEELQSLLDAAPGHLRRALCLAYYVGMRPGAELLGIRWDDVDLTAGCIFIESARKGGPRTRSIALHPDLSAMLSEWKRVDTCDFIVSYRGRKVASLKTSWRATLRRAGIRRRLRLYDCRHAFATAALRQSGDVKAVSVMLGHTRPDTTIRTYTHSDPENERAIINRLPSLVTEVTVPENKRT